MRQQPKPFNRYKQSLIAAGLVILLAAMIHGGLHPRSWVELAIFFVLVFVSESYSIILPGTTTEISVTMPVILGLFLSQGAYHMIVVSSVSMYLANVVTHIGRPIKLLFTMSAYNTAVFIISISMASLGYVLASGPRVAHGHFDQSHMLLPLALWVAICTTTNALIHTTGAALHAGEPWRVLAGQTIRWIIPNYLVTGPSGILFAYLYGTYGLWGILLVLLPFLVGRQALNLYAKQQSAYLETITTLGAYMQHYHPYTKGHLERVAALSDRIAKQMQLPWRSLSLIKDAGMLHDIGKVGVNEEILDKVGKLSDEDWAVIKQHPARGAEILAGMKHLEPIVPWVRGHHERPDGRGYPDSLASGQIPIEAAVIAVADAFDAMTGGLDEKDKRVYRTPLTIDQGIDQVRYGAGTQFDARVVKAFMQVMSREAEENG